VDIASKTTPAKTRARFNIVLKLVQFNCGAARAIGFDEKDPLFPDNDAHAHVYFLDYHTTVVKERKKKARRLADLCRPVFDEP
jgi:hypothetical protein